MYIVVNSKKELMDKFKNTVEESIIKFYEEEPPRMSLTNGIVEMTLKKFDIMSPKISELLETNRVRLIGVTANRRELFDDHYDIDNWVS